MTTTLDAALFTLLALPWADLLQPACLALAGVCGRLLLSRLAEDVASWRKGR